MNLVLDEAEEIHMKTKARKSIGTYIHFTKVNTTEHVAHDLWLLFHEGNWHKFVYNVVYVILF